MSVGLEMWTEFMSAGIRVSFLNTLLIISIANCFQLSPTAAASRQTGWVEIQTFEWLVWRIMGREWERQKTELRVQTLPAQLSQTGSARFWRRLSTISRKTASNSPGWQPIHTSWQVIFFTITPPPVLPLLYWHFYFLQIVRKCCVIKLRATQH